jgi:arylsulfatase A-like enzyme
MRIRHHYAALVELVDFCVGDIVGSLKKQGILDHTTIILCADHGDLLGDFDMVGKKLFYSASIDIPLIVAGPTAQVPGSVHHGLVSLVDIHATILEIAGCPYLHAPDSIPLPSCSMHKHVERKYVFGQLESGFMLLKDRWKLSRYYSGVTTLFDLSCDPMEQQNLVDDSSVQERLHAMDALLQQELVRSILDANEDKRVSTNDSGFGMKSWVRQYPWPGLAQRLSSGASS